MAAPAKVPPELEAELFSRNVGFFGDRGFAAIRDAFVIVVGLGGVGSHAAHMLARSGVRRLRLIDFDQVTRVSNAVCYSLLYTL
jgi:tRNA threonylcarbamoyladenosine dehydratase